MIDLNEIIYNKHSHLEGYEPYDDKQISAIEDCMKEAVRQALELAEQSALVKVELPFFTMSERAIQHPKNKEEWYTVDKDSILQVMGRVK